LGRPARRFRTVFGSCQEGYYWGAAVRVKAILPELESNYAILDVFPDKMIDVETACFSQLVAFLQWLNYSQRTGRFSALVSK
jgi:hypothetical protein